MNDLHPFTGWGLKSQSQSCHIFLDKDDKLVAIAIPRLNTTFEVSNQPYVTALVCSFMYNHEDNLPGMRNFFLRCAGAKLPWP
ncbi:hypothetical protein FS749_007697 [Ceratobasidium sp. UAMH 11750]|nr:hypothetical protein FS749_007697 [Ceratobasidium sp. UAMH 11750]